MTAERIEPNEDASRVMVIAAHPDDPEFGCGATIAKWANEGKHITYVLLTSGDKGSHDPAIRPGQLAAMREREQRDAADALGVENVVFLRYADGVLENTLALRGQLAGIIRHHKPHIVLAIDPWKTYQLHPDHRAAGYAALDAIWAAREWNLFAEQLVGDEDPWRAARSTCSGRIVPTIGKTLLRRSTQESWLCRATSARLGRTWKSSMSESGSGRVRRARNTVSNTRKISSGSSCDGSNQH